MPDTELIQYPCPDCPNEEFRIIKVLQKAKTVRAKREMVFRAGHYRCMCTLCGCIQTFKSKNPSPCEEDQ